MSIEAVKAALKEARKDTFEDGTVIRWTAAGKYTYAAVKCEIGWFTTAAQYNRFVDQILTFEQLLDVLSKSDATDIAVATEWMEITGG